MSTLHPDFKIINQLIIDIKKYRIKFFNNTKLAKDNVAIDKTLIFHIHNTRIIEVGAGGRE